MDWTIDVRELPSYRFGLEEGLQQGLQQGMQQGLERGELAGERRALKRLLLRRFGALPDWVERRIDETTTREAPEGLIDVAVTAGSLDELFTQRD